MAKAIQKSKVKSQKAGAKEVKINTSEATKTKMATSKKITSPIPALLLEVSNILPKVNLPDKKKISEFISRYQPSKTIFVIILVLGMALLVTAKKGWFVAATVNNSPITSWELLSRMDKQYHSQVLNQMINEQIILNEARKNKVVVSGKEAYSKIAQLEANVGGAEVLNGLLSQQGQTRDGLKDQIRIQLLIEKMYGKEATVSAEEVAKFVEENKDQMEATDSAGQIAEATEALKQQKLTQLFQQKFQQLKSAAKIQTF